MARLKEQYKAEVAPALYKKFGYKSTMQIPKIDKVVVNVGCGEAKENAKVLEAVVRDLTTITGQKAVVTKAKKSIANFKLREDMPIGAKVTLRGDKMWEFLDRLFNVALPRVRDFRGISANAFDGRGNYALGIKEQLIFPEIEYDKIDKIRGMDVVICTTAQTDEEARENPKVLDAVVSQLSQITGQKAIITIAKKSVANFKLREGMPVGAKVTLRGDKMWEFLDRLFNVALPRVRDFRGISANAFDGRGNYALGIKEQLIFPEIEYDKIDKIRGMDIVICTTAQTDEEARELLTLVGAPFER